MEPKTTKKPSRKLVVFKRELPFYLMLIPGVTFLIIFSYLPMFGLVMAFQDFTPLRSFKNSPWVGLKNFHDMLALPTFWNVVGNTLSISIAKIILRLLVPLILALLLNEVVRPKFMRMAQTVFFLPYFLSWAVMGGVLRNLFQYDGMADAVTDPRWQRTYGTFGEDPALISEIMAHIIPRIQGSDHGVTEDGVAVTTKHFPGGGARENGFDPHYAAGQWNVYATPGSLETYHLPPFAAAVKAGTSSIMPYYSKPAAAKSAVQHDLAGNTVEMKPYGFAYNKYFIDTMLRGQMGFDGYINSDTGIAHNMAWGVEMLDVPERIGFAVTNAGVDIISGLFDNEAGMEAYNRGKNGYYETHPLPEGFAKEELTLTDEALDRAVARTLTEPVCPGNV